MALGSVESRQSERSSNRVGKKATDRSMRFCHRMTVRAAGGRSKGVCHADSLWAAAAAAAAAGSTECVVWSGRSRISWGGEMRWISKSFSIEQSDPRIAYPVENRGCKFTLAAWCEVCGVIVCLVGWWHGGDGLAFFFRSSNPIRASRKVEFFDRAGADRSASSNRFGLRGSKRLSRLHKKTRLGLGSEIALLGPPIRLYKNCRYFSVYSCCGVGQF